MEDNKKFELNDDQLNQAAGGAVDDAWCIWCPTCKTGTAHTVIGNGYLHRCHVCGTEHAKDIGCESDIPIMRYFKVSNPG